MKTLGIDSHFTHCFPVIVARQHRYYTNVFLDYKTGFGGQFGVQTDRQDKSAVGWDHHEAPQKHESQTDHKIGFGGKFGVQSDRFDKSASNFDPPTKVGTNYTKVKPDIGGAKPSDLRAKWETMAQEKQSESIPLSSTTAPRKNISAKLAIFSNPPQNESPSRSPEKQLTPKQLDKSKTAFLTQNAQEESSPSKTLEKTNRLDQSKIQFLQQSQEGDGDDKIDQPTPKPLSQNKFAQMEAKNDDIINKKNVASKHVSNNIKIVFAQKLNVTIFDCFELIKVMVYVPF